MIKVKALLNRKYLLQRFTGLTLEEYFSIRDKFKSALLALIIAKNNDSQRKRVFGGGNKPKSLKDIDDKLIFILIYVKLYSLQIVQGFLFDLSEGRANIWIHTLLPVLEEALGYALQLPKRGKSWDEIIEKYPELRELGVLADGVERPSRRPKDKNKQKEDYSGKKKHHTKKNVILTNPRNRKIIYLSPSYGGKHHDKKILDDSFETGPSKNGGPPGINHGVYDDINLGLDLGFLGYTFTGIKPILPKKKLKGKDLSEVDRSQNTSFSKLRIKVEHAIAGIKINRSVADIYRNTKAGVDDKLINIACGLHNLRVEFRYVSTS